MSKNYFHQDFISGLKLAPALHYIAISDLRARYKRSILGPLWIVLTLGLGSVGLGIMWSFLWGEPLHEMLPSITVGFLVWIFISSSITEGSTCFTVNSGTLQNVKLPLSFFPMLSFTKALVNFGHSLVIVVAILLIYPPEFSWVQFMFLVGLIVTIIDLYLVVYLCGFLCTRFRDLQPLIASTIPLLFFLSPVLFKLKQAPELKWVMLLNPLTYIITIIRDPILGVMPEWYIYAGSIAIGVIAYGMLRHLVNKKYNNFIFWV
jgi:ABC-type polysaccharide/polyol phosphate export permease